MNNSINFNYIKSKTVSVIRNTTFIMIHNKYPWHEHVIQRIRLLLLSCGCLTVVMIPSHKLLSIWLQIVTLPKYTSHVVGKYIKVSEFYFSGYVTSADNSIYYAFAITDEITD